jgi:hypothetical protein
MHTALHLRKKSPGYAMMYTMKKQMLLALVLILLIPVVVMSGGFLFNLINPEIAAGHSNYALNFQILSFIKRVLLLGSFALAAVLWFVACFLVINAKQRSLWWMLCAALGPLGFAILASLKDATPAETDRYALFVRGLNKYVRVVYEICTFFILWQLAYQAMVVKRNLMIMFESFTTGASSAQIIAIQNASSGMWAFGESLEVMYLAILFYALRPAIFNLAARAATVMSSRKAH